MRTGVTRILARPTVPLLVVAAVLSLFLVHRLYGGSSRTIVVSPGLKAELEQRFRDENDGRSPTATELGEAIRGWQRDEALYREALREGLDRSDATIRKALVDRVRAHAAGAISKREPTDEDLDRWLEDHRRQYEAQQRYRVVVVSFPRSDPDSPAEIEGDELALSNGADPNVLARPVYNGELTAGELAQRFGVDMATGVQQMPVGRWRRLDGPSDLRLVLIHGVQGGLPPAADLRRRMIVDWTAAQEKEAQDQAVQAIVDRYQIEER